MSHADPKVTAPPVGAFQFKAQSAKLAKPDAEGRRRFEAVFYSGDKIQNHWFWGDLVFDISTTKAKPKVACLLNHKSDQIVGSGEVSFGSDMRIEGLLSAKTEFAKQVADQADEGFPWEMSHFIEPGEIDQIKAGQSCSVNGRTFTGPLTVFRHNSIREVSFCATAADAQTSAIVFNKGNHQGAPAMSKEIPTLDELQASVAKLSADLEIEKKNGATLKTANEMQAKEISVYRKERLTEIFKARKEELTDEKAAPFLSMSADQFVATLTFMKPAPAQQRDTKLFSADLPEGEDASGGGKGKTGLVGKAKAMSAKPNP